MITGLIIAGVIAAVFGGAVAVSPKLQQVLRIRGGNAVDKMTTAVEKQRDTYDQLVAKLAPQRASVTRVMGAAKLAAADLETKRKEMEAVKTRYAQAKGMGASEAALNELGAKFATAKAAVTAQEQVVTEANSAAAEARSTLDQTVAAIQKFGQQVENSAAKAELAAALRVTAEARQQSADINSALSQAGQAGRVVDKELEEARAANELSKGSAAEQELAALEAKGEAASGREELDALLGGTPATVAAPAATGRSELDSLVGKPQ